MCQFTFLIVEDNPPTLKLLKSLIQRDFPESIIEVAATVSEGLRLLRSAGSGGPAYDAAILDFKLPQRKGENPELDFSLSTEAAEQSHPVLIARITAFSQDRLVQEHIVQTQVRQPNPSTFLISKRETKWPEELVCKLKKFLYSRQVQWDLSEIFGESAAHHSWGHRPPSGNRGCMTHRLAALCRMIEAHWEDLDEGVLKRVRAILEIDESSGRPKVGLLLGDHG